MQVWWVAVCAAFGLAFAINQNVNAPVGGPIHPAKAVWLTIAIVAFIVLPGTWALRSHASRTMRRIIGVAWVLFLARGAAELVIIYASSAWRTWMGVGHDIVTAIGVTLAVIWFASRGRIDARGRDRKALFFTGLFVALLCCEAWFGYAFGQIGRPDEGQYFANSSAEFRSIILVTEVVVALAVPLLLASVWWSRDQFGPRPGVLRAEVIRTSEFEQMLEEAYALFADHYEGTDRQRFEDDLRDKQLVIVMRDGVDGTLRGFSTIHRRQRRDVRGRRCTVIFSGDTVIDRDYWGQGVLQRSFSTILAQTKLRRPWQPTYWLLICKGYKTYLLMANYFDRSIPRYTLDPPPASLQAMLDEVATERFGDHFDASRGIVEMPADAHERVAAGLGDIGAELIAANPHVRLFVERNPHHARGDELVCLGDFTLGTMVRTVLRTSIRGMAKLRRRRAKVRA